MKGGIRCHPIDVEYHMLLYPTVLKYHTNGFTVIFITSIRVIIGSKSQR